MSYIIFADSISDLNGNNFTQEMLKDKFGPAIMLNKEIQAKGYKAAYFFIDPLLDSFEAANRFYVSILGCTEISQLNVYRSGCGPIQALADAKMLLTHKIADAVFIFGYEPLATIRKNKGKEVINDGMNIFQGTLLPEAYNQLTQQLLKVLDITREEFLTFSNSLYENYQRTFNNKGQSSSPSPDRNKLMQDIKADLFTLSDCANPNIDFTGGLIIVSRELADELNVPLENRAEVKSAEYNVVGDGPDHIETIAGKRGEVFPHLKKAFQRACNNGQIDFVAEFKRGNALLEAYTCYPPIPLGFLLTTGFVENINQMEDFLTRHQITVTGGMNLARAPWNNPALNAVIALFKELQATNREYGLVHGNGGLGGLQGVVIIGKSKR